MHLKVTVWKEKLWKHPDQDFAHFIVTGIEQGSRIGINEFTTFVAAKRKCSQLMSTQQ